MISSQHKCHLSLSYPPNDVSTYCTHEKEPIHQHESTSHPPQCKINPLNGISNTYNNNFPHPRSALPQLASLAIHSPPEFSTPPFHALHQASTFTKVLHGDLYHPVRIRSRQCITDTHETYLHTYKPIQTRTTYRGNFHSPSLSITTSSNSTAKEHLFSFSFVLFVSHGLYRHDATPNNDDSYYCTH